MSTKPRFNSNLIPGGYELGGTKSSAEGDRARRERRPLSPVFPTRFRVAGAGKARRAG